MKILVYGAGIIGCELAHMLVKANHDVTLQARGKWRDTIEKNGLIIHHHVQRCTTIDRIVTIEKLKQDDICDLIFVAMRFDQLEKVLLEIAANRSGYIVLVGNNMSAEESVHTLSPSETTKEVSFGFQATGGRREEEKVISVHTGVGMTIGGLHSPLSAPLGIRIKEAFSGICFHLNWEENMDAWLKCHMVFILPVAYICYATDFNLRKSTRRQRNTAIDAAIEGYDVLKKLGYSIRPTGSDGALTKSRNKIQALLWVMAKHRLVALPRATIARTPVLCRMLYLKACESRSIFLRLMGLFCAKWGGRIYSHAASNMQGGEIRMGDKIKSAYRKSKNIYDDVLTQSKWWSRLYIRFFWGVDDIEITKKLFDLLPDDFGGALLDVPCGTINLTAGKYAKLKNARITCLDYSEDMLEGAKTQIEKHGLSCISLMQGDVGNMPLESAVFDAVLSMNGFHVFPDKEKAYAEIARILKPGGIFLGCFYIRGERKRSDFVVNAILSKKGWFTPPFQTKNEVLATLQKYYSNVELFNDKSMTWFKCTK